MTLHFVTMGDQAFFDSIVLSIQQIEKLYPTAHAVVYDWGLTDAQVNRLRRFSTTHVVTDWRSRFTDVPSARIVARQCLETADGRPIGRRSARDTARYLVKKYVLFDREHWETPAARIARHARKEYLLAQKPYCMLDCVRRFAGQLVALDADAMLVSRIDELFQGEFDIGVTLRRPHEISLRVNACHVLNSGVVVFAGPSALTVAFLEAWIDTMQDTHERLIEQTALTRLVQRADPDIYSAYYTTGTLTLDGLPVRVRVLPCDTYNFNWIEEGVDVRQNKILHFKGARHARKYSSRALRRLGLQTGAPAR